MAARLHQHPEEKVTTNFLVCIVLHWHNCQKKENEQRQRRKKNLSFYAPLGTYRRNDKHRVLQQQPDVILEKLDYLPAVSHIYPYPLSTAFYFLALPFAKSCVDCCYNKQRLSSQEFLLSYISKCFLLYHAFFLLLLFCSASHGLV